MNKAVIESIQHKKSTAKCLGGVPKYLTVACSNQNAHVPTTNSDKHFKTYKKFHNEKATCMRKCVIKYQTMGTLLLFSSSEMSYLFKQNNASIV